MQLNSRIEGGFMLKTLAIEPKWGLGKYTSLLDSMSVSPTLSTEIYRESRKAAQVTFHAGGRTGQVAQLEFKGVMMAEGGMCTPGIDALCRQIEETALNTKVSAIVLNTHTGGGEVYAAQRLSNAIIQARKAKPVVMFVDGMCASGGYWAGAHCDEIVGGGNISEFGSIGVVLSLSQSLVEELKAEYLSIFADGSEAKQGLVKDIIDGNFEAIKKRELNPIRSEFIKVIKAGRGDIDDAAFTGAMFMAPQAKKLGLIDHIGTRDKAIARAITLANKRDRSRGAKIALQHARG